MHFPLRTEPRSTRQTPAQGCAVWRHNRIEDALLTAPAPPGEESGKLAGEGDDAEWLRRYRRWWRQERIGALYGSPTMR